MDISDSTELYSSLIAKQFMNTHLSLKLNLNVEIYKIHTSLLSIVRHAVLIVS